MIWSRAVLNKIINIIPKTEIDYSKFKRTDFKPELNQHLDLCTCKLCGDLLQTPLMFTKCEHSFCLKCITQMVEGKNISTTKCPTCLVKINDVNVTLYHQNKFITYWTVSPWNALKIVAKHSK